MAAGTIKVELALNDEFKEKIKELYEDGMMCAYASGYRAGLKDAANDIIKRLEKVAEVK